MQPQAGEIAGKEGFGLPDSVKVRHEKLDQLSKDYPRGPHDQPQSMCPAFGSLRVGLRMRRTA
ncbi:MAG: chlorophyllide reductase subunit Y, partial [Betaproteobacteria bacterium]|nr:chlorophyllide reductase subunit Y [Betaproteobacteria bacterium]